MHQGNLLCGLCYFWTLMHRGKLLSYIFVKPLLPPHQALCPNSELREDDKQPSRILLELRQESAASSDLCPSNSKDVCAGLFQVQHLYWALCSFLNLRFRTTVIRVGRSVRHASGHASYYRVGRRALREWPARSRCGRKCRALSILLCPFYIQKGNV